VTTQTYQAASRQMLAQARTELAAGDLRQASEKGWGAAAQMVKAIADRRGWEHKTHRHIWEAVRRLTDEVPGIELERLFRSANHLHSNFYENLDSRDAVADALDEVERFIGLLEPMA